MSYQYIKSEGKPIKAWVNGVQLEPQAREQLLNTASMPFIFKHLAVMPDVHYGMGATVGSVVATQGAVIPAAVGVDIGCGMVAVKLSLTANDLPQSLKEMRDAIEKSVPVGFEQHQHYDKHLSQGFINHVSVKMNELTEKHPAIDKIVKDATKKALMQCGTLGGGNHFIEICLDENNGVWIMLHSGSRGIGNIIGRYFIEVAKQDMRTHHINLKDDDLSYLSEGTKHFDDYVEWVEWAQVYAAKNRDVMLELVLNAIQPLLPPFALVDQAINCHHNYISKENHFKTNVFVTRKGAVRARVGDLGIIPGSMGAKSYIVRGKGDKDSFCSCSHGAGRVMSRAEAKRRFTVDDQINATKGVECKKDESVIDEIPMAYKDIDKVMEAQSDLVEVVYTLKQVLCVKG